MHKKCEIHSLELIKKILPKMLQINNKHKIRGKIQHNNFLLNHVLQKVKK